MTTWHDDNTLANTVWHSLYTAMLAEEYVVECRSVIAICVACPDLAQEIRLMLADTKTLADQTLNSND